MATNQMEEVWISKQRNKVLGAIIDRYLLMRLRRF